MADETSTPGPAQPEGFDLGAHVVQEALRLFWLPGYSGQQMLPLPDGYGGVHHIAIPQFNGPTPLQSVANLFHKAHGADIARQVTDKVNLAALVDQIAALVIADIVGKNQYDRLTPTAEQIRTMVREKVAVKLTDRAVEEYDAQQAAMLAAYRREQARERQAAVAEGDGVEGIPGEGSGGG